MKVIIPPNTYTPKEGDISVFMAGGITGCPDWQREVIARLSESPAVVSPLVLLNPRRPSFDTSRDEESDFQIRWEHEHLRKAKHIFFWFPKEGKCMITLYELGWAIGAGRSIRVGCHPEYERAFDVHKQVTLAKPGMTVVSTLEEVYGLLPKE